MNFLKLVEDGLQLPAEDFVEQLKENREANIAKIEAAAAGAEASSTVAIQKFVGAAVSKNAELSFVYNAFVERPLVSELHELEQSGASTIPQLYDEAVDFLGKEVAKL